MKQTSAVFTAIAVTLVFGLGTIACSGDMGSTGSASPSSAVGSGYSQEPAMPTDTSSGPAYRTVSGKVIKVDGSYYDVEEYSGSRVRLHVGSGTVMISGDKKVGDKIRAEITRGGHANSVQ